MLTRASGKRLLLSALKKLCLMFAFAGFVHAQQAPSSVISLNSGEWQLINFPGQRSDQSYADLLGSSLPLLEYSQTWVLFRFNAASQTYEEIALEDSVSATQSVWITQVADPVVSISVPDAPRLPSAAQCTEGRDCVELPLFTSPSDFGWSMVGNPFKEVVETSLIEAVLPGSIEPCATRCSLDQAVLNGYIIPPLWRYDPASDAYFDVVLESVVQPLTGFWVGSQPIGSASMPENRLVLSLEKLLPPDANGLLPGDPADSALDALVDAFERSATTAEVGPNREFLGKLGARLAPGATVGAVNAALASVSATLGTQISGFPVITIEVPLVGSVAEHGATQRQLLASGAFASVYTISGPDPRKWFPAPPSLPGGSNLDHIEAIRGTALWNTRNSPKYANMSSTLLVTDFFRTETQQSAVPALPNFTFDGVAEDDADDDHGVFVAGIIAARHDVSSAAGLYPRPEMLDLKFYSIPASIYQTGARYESWLKIVTKIAGEVTDTLDATTVQRIIVNTSLGFVPLDGLQERYDVAQAWLNLIGNRRGEFVHAVAAGNEGQLAGWQGEAWIASPWTLASFTDNTMCNLVSLVASTNEPVVCNTTQANEVALRSPVNTLIVGSLQNTTAVPGGTPTPSAISNRLAPDQLSPIYVAAVGEQIHSLGVLRQDGIADCSANVGVCSGTSFATPQVSAIAASLLAMNPSLSVSDIVNIINESPIDYAAALVDQVGADGMSTKVDTSAQQVDALNAILRADTALTPLEAPVRLSMLDVATEGVEPGQSLPDTITFAEPDGIFGPADIRRFAAAFNEQQSLALHSRFDLNGDGFTGGFGGAEFDLDADGAISTSTSFGNADFTVTLDESFVTDEEILCYYAFSTLFGNSASIEAELLSDRDVALFGLGERCGFQVDSIAVTVASTDTTLPVENRWFIPTSVPIEFDILLDLFGKPVVETYLGFWQGSARTSPTCSGEMGGPVFSSQVDLGSQLFTARALRNHPAPIAGNRAPCSMFFAHNASGIWFNIVARQQLNAGISVEAQMRYQRRYDRTVDRLELGTARGFQNFQLHLSIERPVVQFVVKFKNS